ncbi:MAG: tryptophan synthase subunit alpha [Phycisphaerae bacterium]|nr:tryptophan synthase subunit alpha [Phycisphaerae bacterium]
MGRLADMFSRRHAEGRGALMPFIVAGHPRPDALPEVLKGLEDGGADAVEIGIPFSDPIADGPVIAAAMHDALTRGGTVASVLDAVQHCRSSTELPLIAMVSISIVDRLGGPAFIDRLADAGFDGVILPDADLEAIGPHRTRALARNIAFTSLIAPDTSPERAARIAADASEFIYLLARAGLTGQQADAPDLGDRVKALKLVTSLPLAAGFGISTPDHVQAALADAQGAIVGSALVRSLAAAEAEGRPLEEAARRFVQPLAEAVNPAPQG